MPARILIVEDDAMIRRLLVTTLQREALEIDTAADGLEGLQKIRSGVYGVVVLDLMLPEMSGFDVLQACAASVPPPRPTFIVTTAFDSPSRRELDPALVTAVIPKPFDLHMLTEIVRESARAWAETVKLAASGEAALAVLPPDQPLETA